MDVVGRKVERDQELEQQRKLGVRAGEVAEETRGRAAVRDHVEDGTELGALAKGTGGLSVDGVEQTGDSVRDRARFGVRRHLVQRNTGEDHSRITNQVRDEQKDILIDAVVSNAVAVAVDVPVAMADGVAVRMTVTVTIGTGSGIGNVGGSGEGDLRHRLTLLGRGAGTFDAWGQQDGPLIALFIFSWVRRRKQEVFITAVLSASTQCQVRKVVQPSPLLPRQK